MLKWLSDVFWTDSLWLAPGFKWTDVQNSPDAKVLYPDSRDYYYQIPLVVGLLVLRFLLEKYCFRPVGIAIGIRVKKKRILQSIPLLEAAYNRSVKNKDVTALAKQLDMAERQVERWFRLRRNKDKTSNLGKFCEHCWKTCYLACSVSYGLYVLWGKDWFWDLDKCYVGYPHQGVTNDIWWYYMMSMAYIVASTITFFRDVKRKDYWQTFVHHILNFFMVYFSWTISWFRIGATLIPIMDSSETLLEMSKAFLRAKYEFLGKVIFFIFTPIWFYSRLYLFPQILYSTTIRAPAILGEYFAGFVLSIMGYSILFLTLYWSLLILRVLYNCLVHGIERDVRSSSSEVSGDNATLSECEPYRDQTNITNGKMVHT